MESLEVVISVRLFRLARPLIAAYVTSMSVKSGKEITARLNIHQLLISAHKFIRSTVKFASLIATLSISDIHK
jgi:hypothetical protein